MIKREFITCHFFLFAFQTSKFCCFHAMYRWEINIIAIKNADIDIFVTCRRIEFDRIDISVRKIQRNQNPISRRTFPNESDDSFKREQMEIRRIFLQLRNRLRPTINHLISRDCTIFSFLPLPPYWEKPTGSPSLFHRILEEKLE